MLIGWLCTHIHFRVTIYKEEGADMFLLCDLILYYSKNT